MAPLEKSAASLEKPAAGPEKSVAGAEKFEASLEKSTATPGNPAAVLKMLFPEVVFQLTRKQKRLFQAPKGLFWSALKLWQRQKDLFTSPAE